jgi:hypothetical protein
MQQRTRRDRNMEAVNLVSDVITLLRTKKLKLYHYTPWRRMGGQEV